MKLYACIISPDLKRDRDALLEVAQQFSYNIELLEDGILFDVSGLQNLVGDAKNISKKIVAELEKNALSGKVAVADTTDAATLLARGSLSSPPARGGVAGLGSPPGLRRGADASSAEWSADGVVGGDRPLATSSDNFPELPLRNLSIDDDTLNVFNDLGIKSIHDLRQIPVDELITRYGQQFKNVVDVIEQKRGRL